MSCIKINFVIKILSLLLLLLFLQSCDKNHYCVAADDFGFEKQSFSSVGKNVKGYRQNQYSEWEDSGLVLNGDLIYFVVRGAGSGNGVDQNSEWTSWFCGNESKVCSFMNPEIYHTCNSPNWCPNPDSPGKYANITNAPCILRQGKGLYGLAISPNAPLQDPNQTKKTIIIPSTIGGVTFHLGDRTDLQHWRDMTLGGYRGQVNADYRSRLYFKILDNYYKDNAGQYSVIFKSGAVDPDPGPIEKIITFVTDTLDRASERTFKQMIALEDYRLALRALLTLYIIVTGILFSIGVVQVSQTEFIVRIFKLILVTQLLTGASSWEFFNDHFFKIFTKGLNELIGIILRSVTNGQINGMAFFDKMIDLFFSYETTAKIWSLLTADAIGLVAIPIIYIAIFFFIVAIAQGVIFYLVSYIALSLLIVLAPVFIVFMLFNITKDLFEGWIRQLGNYFIQPLLVFASLGLMAQVIINQMYIILGFTVCWKTIIEFLGLKLFMWWKAEDFTRNHGNIHLPGYTIDPDDPDRLCAPYECEADRYYDLPFLDMEKNKDLIDMFFSGHWGGLFNEIFMLCLLCYLLMKFHETVPDVAKGIAGTAASQADLAGTAKATSNTFGKAASAAALAAADKLTKGKASKAREGIKQARQAIKEFKEGVQDKVGGAIDNAKGKVSDKMTPQSIKNIKEGAKNFDKNKENSLLFKEGRDKFKDEKIGKHFDAAKKRMEQKLADVSRHAIGNKAESPFGVDHARQEAQAQYAQFNGMAEQIVGSQLAAQKKALGKDFKNPSKEEKDKMIAAARKDLIAHANQNKKELLNKTAKNKLNKNPEFKNLSHEQQEKEIAKEMQNIKKSDSSFEEIQDFDKFYNERYGNNED